jgi:lipopolysaccharide transport system ATP-binding protein
VRLAFAVATCRRPDILIVDEALSVGDLLFQQRSFQRIKQFREEGTTLLFVSHSPSTVFALCSRAILLNQGGLVLDGTPRAVIALYETLMLAQSGRIEAAATAARSASTKVPPPAASRATANAGASVDSGVVIGVAPSSQAATAEAKYADARATAADQLADIRTAAMEHVAVRVLDREGRPTESVVSGQEVTLEIAARFAQSCRDPHVGFRIHNRLGEPLFQTTTWGMGRSVGSVGAGETVRVRFAFALALYPGEYSFTVGVAEGAMTDGWFARDLYRAFHVRTITVLQDVRNIHWVGTWNVDPDVSIDRAPASADLLPRSDA